MTHVNATSRRSEQGFTLVELAIVMVIIGLLIGGILKGQELISNAKISGTVTQLKGLDAAMNTFEDKYNARPGLMSDATVRLAGCVDPCADVSEANYGDTLDPVGSVDSAQVQVFLQLSAADLISGVDPTGDDPVVFGKALPNVKAGGGMWVGTATSATDAGAAALSINKHYAVVSGSPTSLEGALTATASAQIDRKMDDGQPETGSVQSDGECVLSGSSPAAYDEANSAASCILVSRVLN